MRNRLYTLPLVVLMTLFVGCGDFVAENPLQDVPNRLDAPIVEEINNNKPTLLGSCEQDDTITILIDTQSLANTTTCSNGGYRIIIGSALENGAHNLTAIATRSGVSSTVSAITPIFITDTTEDNGSSGTPVDGTLTLSGKVTYDRVKVNKNYVGLDYDNTVKESAKQVVVTAIGSHGQTLASTTTDDNGAYRFTNIPKETVVKIRVDAKMQKLGQGGWDVQVHDNTRGDVLYVIEGEFSSTRSQDSVRNLNASSGWSLNSGSYTQERQSAPFAILGSIYQAMQKVKSADSGATFPALVAHWSKSNIASGNGSEEELSDGLIMTSHFDGENNLYILGDANGDTDEYDDHIVIHEWGHYFEAKFSRADSRGGPHGEGERLDIRLAFGEGWGNAWSAIATDNSIYYDSSGWKQGSGWSMDIEAERHNTPGWYSEASIQRILYDLYDSNDDGDDRLSLGFKPLYDVLVGKQKTTPAFTSIFSFITELKADKSQDTDAIDDILMSEDISTIDNIYGSNHHNLYSDMDIENIGTLCTTREYGISNKLNTHKYMRFTVNQSGNYKVQVRQNNGAGSDPDFALYKTSPFTTIGEAEEVMKGIEQQEYELSSGDYLLDVSDYNDLSLACFDISINLN